MVKFNQSKYIQDYKKEHYKQFKVDLKADEMKQLEQYLKKVGLTKAQFLRYCIIKFTSEYDNQSK